jgi:hypothetical protein
VIRVELDLSTAVRENEVIGSEQVFIKVARDGEARRSGGFGFLLVGLSAGVELSVCVCLRSSIGGLI